LILAGKKTWEIRRTRTNTREWIALGNTNSKNYEGYATIIDCKELNVKDLKKFGDKHQANEFLDRYAGERETLFAWVLPDITVEPSSKPYSYSTGSWCKTLT
jgi:ASCH domain